MLDERDLQAIAQIMDEKISASESRMKAEISASESRMKAEIGASESRMIKRMDKIQEDLDQLKEDHEITRDALNYLCGWAEKVSGAMSFPLPKP